MRTVTAAMCVLAGVVLLLGEGRPVWLVWATAGLLFAGAFYVTGGEKGGISE